MREKAVVSKRFISQNEVFADLINYYLYDGKQVICEDDLEERDSLEVTLVSTGESFYAIEKMRDILKECVIKSGNKAIYLIVGIENQSEVHYAMTIRKFLYDAINYMTQVEEISRENRKNKKYQNGKEYISGFRREDKLKPVITLVVYWGAEPWDGPRSLYEMLAVDDPEILKFVDDYTLKIIVPNEINDFKKFKTDVRYVLEFISASKDVDKLKKIAEDMAYSQVDNEAIHMINCFADMKIQINQEKGVSDMCLGMQQWIDQEVEKEKERGMEALVRRLKKFCPDFESLYNEIVQDTEYCHVTREQIKKYY